MSILVIDDSEDIRRLISTFLKSAGYEKIHTSGNAVEAFDLLGIEGAKTPEGTEDVDLILLDILLPDMDGIDICRAIRKVKQYEEVPIIMVTAIQESEKLETAFLAGATDYIRKPIDKTELLARVRAAMKLKNKLDLCSRISKELEQVKKELRK